MNREEVEKLIQQNPHLKEYLDSLRERMEMPKFFKSPPIELSEEKFPNIIYPTKGSVFVHIYRLPGMEEIEYHAIEPSLGEEEKKLKDKVMKLMLRDVVKKDIPEGDEGLRKVLKDLLDEIIITTESDVKIKSSRGISKLLGKSENRIYVKPHEKERLEYEIMKTLIGGGPLEPFMRDPYIEDIHVITGEYVHLIHKVFGMIKTNVTIPKDEAPRFTRALSEKMGNPVSEAKPISDGILPDGSRANIIYSSAVSIKGPSMSIRKFTEVPISVTQLIKWKTISAGIAAYFWICLQYGRNIILCGETACGKTTTMNAFIPFIPPERKIYTAENTPELKVPHEVWQRLLTKTTGPEESRVDLFDLLVAALRSRPDYIIPGEVRGAEGSIVFQAMQTGHPVMTTFHAGNVTKVIQRFTSDPINVPKTFMDNLDVVLIQSAVERRGKKVRRCISVDEIEGYNREADGIMARKAFEWDPLEDVHRFVAYKNSYILEERIARNAGYADPTEIYEEFDLRKRILERMVEEDILDYYEVVKIIWTYYREGVDALPINV
ncbi:MAG: hypothetical protein FE042_00435 [Thermoplasmata archaeon]|nr:MAG: hypothetical protein FE042_00435 [Thermoplasmata archaeon]